MFAIYAAPTMDAQTPSNLPSRGLPRVATAIAVAAWGIALVALCFTVAARPPGDVGLWFFAVDTMVACVYGTVAAVTLSRRLHPVPWIIAGTALGGGLAALGYAWKMFEIRHPEMPDLLEVQKLQNTAWVPGTLALFLVVPWLVRDHPLRWEWLGIATGAGVVGVIEYQLYAKDAAWDQQMYIATVVVGVLTAGVVELRHRFGPVAERNGLGWLAVGTLVMALSFLPLTLDVTFTKTGTPTVNIFGDSFDFLDVLNLTPALHLAAQAVFPAAILVAVLRGRMWGLGLVVSRTTLSALLTLGLILIYLAVSVIFEQLLPGDGLAHLLGAGAVAIAVQPARLWLESRVNRLVYGDAAADPTKLVRRIGSQLGVAGDADDLFAGLARDLGTSMRLESVTLRADEVGEVRWGTPTSAPIVMPLRHRGVDLGTIEVTAPPGETLGPRGEQLVTDFGAVGAAAVAVLHQARQVEQARERLTRARLEERRVIRREIHDGLGPSLAGLRLGLQGARNLLGRDDQAAAEILERLQAELDQRVNEVRTLSHNLLPPVLDELGLVPALHELAARHSENGLVVETRADLPEGLPTPLAAAAYGIASEALVNALRHSGAGHCRIEATIAGESLVLTVADDGTGIPADATPGVGTRSMRERADELGGSLTVGQGSGSGAGRGTVVRAELPLEVARV